MKTTSTPLRDFRQTVSLIKGAAKLFKSDIGTLAGLSAVEFFNHVRALPYVEDPDGIERVSRPAFTLDGSWNNSRDCDDKTLLMGAYFETHSVPWRIVVAGNSFDPLRGCFRPHHVYPEAMLNGQWIPFDATFPDRSEIGKRLYADETGREPFREVYAS